MKRFLTVLLCLVSACAFARIVTLSEATVAAKACAADSSVGLSVKTVIPWEADGNVIGYLADCGDKVIMLSADTGMPPVLAIVNGTVERMMNSGVLSRMNGDVKTADSIVKSNASSRVLLASSAGKSLPTIISDNRNRWNGLGVKDSEASTIRFASSSVSDDLEEDDYVIPGFEDGGVYTHWGQHVARELTDYTGRVNGRSAGFAAWPLYNYYMVWENEWGAPDGLGAPTMPPYSMYSLARSGTRTSDGYAIPAPYSGDSFGLFADGFRPRNFYPCGCVATAYAAMFQCLSVTGCNYAASEVFAPLETPRRQPYDWDDTFRVCTNYNGSAYFVADDPPANAGLDDEDSWDYIKIAVTKPGAYDWSILPWSYGGYAKTNMYYGVEDFHKSVGTTNCVLNFASADADGKLMTPGARELCARVTYNFGGLLNMVYRRGIATSLTSNLVHRVIRSEVFPGFGRYGFISAKWDGPTAGKIIRAGNPLALSVWSSEDGGHSVLATGRKRILGTDFTRLFMGWNGESDGWYCIDGVVDIVTTKYEFSAIRSMNAFGGYDGAAVPVHGRVVDSSGSPVGLVDVTLTNVRDGLVTNLKSGDDGYFRGWVKALTKGSSATTSDDFSYTVSCGSDSHTFTANSYLLGDGPTYNGRYDNLGSWSSQFPTQNVTFVVSAGNRNGYAYGTPADFDRAVAIAVKRLKPLVVVNGTSGTQSEADAFVSRLSENVSKRFVFYFVDASDSTFGVKDSGYSLMIVDPRVFDKSGLWTPENGVLKHGSFDNDYDFQELLGSAWNVFDKKYLWSDHL